MVDVSAKPAVLREATGRGQIKLRKQTVRLIKDGKVEKGDPFRTAQIAGILAAKKTSSLIPLCHHLPLTSVNVHLRTIGDSRVEAEATVKTKARTGVEMEVLTAVSVALLTVWDMTKQYEKDADGQYPNTVIEKIWVVNKLKQKR